MAMENRSDSWEYRRKFYLQPDSANPVKLWVNDFDQNGNPDDILSKTVKGKDMPVFLKHDLNFKCRY
jgi:hypothetical protein